jgi:hypothetical protein
LSQFALGVLLWLEHDFASNAGRQQQLGVGQGEAHAKRATRGIDHAVDHGDRGGKSSADRGFGSNLPSATDADLTVAGNRYDYLHTKLIDLRERQDWALLVSIFPGDEKAFDDYAADRTSQGALIDDLLDVLHLERCYIHIEQRFLQLLLGHVGLGKGFLHRGERADGLGVQLIDTSMFSAQELQTSLGGFDRRLIGGAGARQRQRRGLDTILQLAEDLALADYVSPVDIKTGNDADDRGREPHDLLGLDNTVVFGRLQGSFRVCASRWTSEQQGQAGQAGWKGSDRHGYGASRTRQLLYRFWRWIGHHSCAGIEGTIP